MAKQNSFIAVDPDPEVRYRIFHDESGNYVPGGGDRWLVHGVLLVPFVYLSKALSILTEIRKTTGYLNELHFAGLRMSASGPKGS